MEEVYLRELSLNDGEKELDFLRKFPKEENGFQNPCKEEFLSNLDSFRNWLIDRVNKSNGIGVAEGRVPETVYWIIMNDEMVGIGRLRHHLNDNLLKHGGSIGYGVSSDHRGKGIGNKALSLLLEESKKYDQEEVLLTVDSGNLASRKVIENNGGVLRKEEDGTCFYWIKIKDKQAKTV